MDERLSQWAPLTIVRAFAGYGREIEVAAWLEHQRAEGVASAWVKASRAGDGAPSFEQGLSDFLLNRGWPIGPRPTGSGDQRARRAREALSAGLAERRFVLVVSKFHHVLDEQVLRRLLQLLSEHGNFHIFACCEGAHPVESLVVGSVAINAIEPEATARWGLARPALVIGELLDPIWAKRVGEVVVEWSSTLDRLVRSPEPSVGPAATGRVESLEEFEDESLLRHLMRLSIAGPTNWRQFRELCGDPDPRQLLAAMEATGMVERMEGPGEMTFRISPAIRDAMREQYVSNEPVAVRELHRVLAEWLEGHDKDKRVALEFHHAAAGENLELMDHLWSENLAQMLKDDAGLVSETLDALPATAVASRPSMQVFREILHIALADDAGENRRATIRAFADACAGLIRQHWETMPLNELLIVATGCMIQLRLLGRFQDSSAFGDRINARANVLASTQPMSRGRLAWFHLQRGITYSLLLDQALALRSYRRAWEHSTGSSVDFIHSHAAANLALTYAIDGDSGRSRQWLSRHRGYDTSGWPGDEVVRTGGHLAAGLLALDRLDIAGARAELDHFGDDPVSLELWPYVAYLHAQIALHSSDVVEELARLDHMQRACDAELSNKGAAATLLARARADLLIASGQGERAKQLLASQGNARSFTRVPVARVRLLGGHADQASSPIDPLTWDPATPIRDRLEMLLIGAVAALRYNDVRNAPRLINQALELYEDTGILRPFATVPSDELGQLLALAERGLEPDDAAVLAEQGLVYPALLDMVELSERELAVLEALARTSSRQEIADSLFVSVNTVKTHLGSIYHKIGSKSRAETLAKARKHGFLA